MHVTVYAPVSVLVSVLVFVFVAASVSVLVALSVFVSALVSRFALVSVSACGAVFGHLYSVRSVQCVAVFVWGCGCGMYA